MATTASRSDEAIAREMYEAFNRGDIDTVLENMADDVEWIEPEGAVDGGTYRGPRSIATELFEPVEGLFESFTVDVDRYLAGGDCTVVVGHFRGVTTAGDSFDIPCVHLVEFEDGKMTRFQNYADTVLWNEAVGGA